MKAFLKNAGYYHSIQDFAFEEKCLDHAHESGSANKLLSWLKNTTRESGGPFVEMHLEGMYDYLSFEALNLDAFDNLEKRHQEYSDL